MLNNLRRRDALKQIGCGFGSLALAGLCQQAKAASGPLAPRAPMVPARAKRIIFLFMQGGPSQVDTFDYKPALAKYDGKELSFRDARTLAKTGDVKAHPVMRSPWNFQRYGDCGQHVSELFPETARHVDDLCFLKGLHTEGVAHGPSTLFLHTGSTNLIRPSMGSWVTYGLGTENENLPGFVTIGPSAGNGGPRNYSSAFLPAHYQGTAIGRAGMAAGQATIDHLEPANASDPLARQRFDLLTQMNQLQLGNRTDDELEAVIESFELAARMQMHAPEILNVDDETTQTRALYGIDQPNTDNFGRQCLMARRLAEAGVRFIQVTYGDNSNNPRWDQHNNIGEHAKHAVAVDKPISGLLTDLKQRGLLEDTIVWWGGEFGRNPYKQNSDGRDHNPNGFTHFLAGGGVKHGFSFGETDEFGHRAIDGKVHMHDLHATLLHLLGLDHERLTYRYAGRDFRLTDIAGRVVDQIFA